MSESERRGTGGGEAPGLLGRAATQVARAYGTADNARRALLSPSGLRGAALETAWVAAHLAMYPFGVADERTLDVLGRMQVQDLPPVQRGLVVGDVAAAGTPILLLHGIVDNRSIFTVLRRGLRRRGFGVVASFNYHSLFGDMRQVAVRLADVVEQLCEDTGYEQIHVVGHSMGGLIARYYVQRLGGDEHVHTLVTLGTPHGGTSPARYLPHPMVRQLRPAARSCTSWPSRRRAAAPGSCRSGPTSTRWSSRSSQARSSTRTCSRATCSYAASATSRCRSTGE